MRDNKQHITPMQFIPMYFDHFDEDDKEDSEMPSDAEVERMRAQMRAINEEYKRTHATE